MGCGIWISSMLIINMLLLVQSNIVIFPTALWAFTYRGSD